jgi:hypothetical protein
MSTTLRSVAIEGPVEACPVEASTSEIGGADAPESPCASEAGNTAASAGTVEAGSVVEPEGVESVGSDAGAVGVSGYRRDMVLMTEVAASYRFVPPSARIATKSEGSMVRKSFASMRPPDISEMVVEKVNSWIVSVGFNEVSKLHNPSLTAFNFFPAMLPDTSIATTRFTWNSWEVGVPLRSLRTFLHLSTVLVRFSMLRAAMNPNNETTPNNVVFRKAFSENGKNIIYPIINSLKDVSFVAFASGGNPTCRGVQHHPTGSTHVSFRDLLF